jgi:hypothetical protein
MFSIPFDPDDSSLFFLVEKISSPEARKEILSENLFSITVPVQSADLLLDLLESAGYPLTFEIAEKLFDAAGANQFPEFEAFEHLYNSEAPIEIRCQHRFEIRNTTPKQALSETYLYSRSSSDPLVGIRISRSIQTGSIEATVELASLTPEQKMQVVDEILELIDHRPLSKTFPEYTFPPANATESPSILKTEIYPGVFLTTIALDAQPSHDKAAVEGLNARVAGPTPRAFLCNSPLPKSINSLLKIWKDPALSALSEIDVFRTLRSFVTAHQPLCHNRLLCALRRSVEHTPNAPAGAVTLTTTRSVRLGSDGDTEEHDRPDDFDEALSHSEWDTDSETTEESEPLDWHEQNREDFGMAEQAELEPDGESYRKVADLHPLDAPSITSSIAIVSPTGGMQGCCLVFRSHSYPFTSTAQLGEEARRDRPSIGVYLPFTPVPGRYPTIRSQWGLFREVAKALEVTVPFDRIQRQLIDFIGDNEQVRTVDYCLETVIIRTDIDD